MPISRSGSGARRPRSRFYAVNGWLVAQERTRGVLMLQLWMNLVNIVLDLWFVLDLGWGVRGVAVATLSAERTGLLLGLWLCRTAFAAINGATGCGSPTAPG